MLILNLNPKTSRDWIIWINETLWTFTFEQTKVDNTQDGDWSATWSQESYSLLLVAEGVLKYAYQDDFLVQIKIFHYTVVNCITEHLHVYTNIT